MTDRKKGQGFFEERGDIPVNYAQKPKTPPDAIVHDQIDRLPAKVGNAVSDYSVYSAFSTRPINAFDVVLPYTIEGAPAGDYETYAVNGNKVLIITAVQLDLSVYEANFLPPNNNMFITFLRNGNPITDNVLIPVVNVYGQKIPTYYITGPNETIGVRITLTAAHTVVTDAYFLFFGTELLSQGRATQYEIANQGVLGYQQSE